MEKKLNGLYFVLFNAVTSAINELNKETIHLEHVVEALKILKNAQQTTEEMILDNEPLAKIIKYSKLSEKKIRELAKKLSKEIVLQ